MDDFIDGARRYADIAATKTNEFIEISKLKLDKTRLQSKVRENYQKLGKLCFKMSESGTDLTKDMNDIIDIIRSLKEDIAWIDEQLREAKPHKTCQKCGTANPTSCVYCSACGEKLQ